VLLVTSEISGGIAKIDSASGGQWMELSRVFSYTEIGEYSSSEAVSKSIELRRPGEELEVALSSLMAADV
jgi:hypothetical protein